MAKLRRSITWPLLTLVSAVLATIFGLIFSQAAAPTLLVDAGSLVRWGLPIISTLAHLTSALVLGGLFLLVFILPIGPAWQRIRVVTAVASGVWTVLLTAQLLFTYAATAGRSIGGDGFDAELVYYVTELEAGRARLIAILLAAATTVVCTAIAGQGTAMTALIFAVVVLMPIATTGHAAGADHHELALTGMFLHILSAGVWLGALLMLIIAVWRPSGFKEPGTSLTVVVSRYSTVAVWVFVGIWVSGIASAVIRFDSWSDLGTQYGLLLLTKVLLTLILGGFGWWHRRMTIPALEERPSLFWRIAAVEVVVMGAVVGLASVLGRSEPPVPQEPRTDLTPAETLSRRALPPEPVLQNWFTQWYPDLLFGIVAAVLLFMYLRWVLRLRRRGDQWPINRTIWWVIGVLLFAYVNLGGPAVYGALSLSAHMLGHMAMVMVIPIFLVLGAPVTLALRALPRRRDGTRGPREWLFGLINSPWAKFFANPLVAAGNIIVSMVLFYLTDLLELAMTTHLGHIIMVVHFSLAGYMFANVLIGIDPGPTRPSHPLRMLLLFATMAAHAFFGLALMSYRGVLAADYFGALGLPWGVDALYDQQIAGQITWGIGEIPSLALALLVGVSWVRSDERVAKRLDRAADRDGDAELNAYNEMLAQMEARQSGATPSSTTAGGAAHEEAAENNPDSSPQSNSTNGEPS